MNTSKPIATISYNSPTRLLSVLQALQSKHIISFWAYMFHYGEDDEAGKKPHIHLYVEPAKRLQTEELRELLKEFDPEHPDKLKGCLSFVSSKFGDWYMYVLHDVKYLASKGKERKYHYSHEMFVTSDNDDLICKSRMIDLIALSPYADMEQAQKQGLSFAQYFSRGTIPLPQLALYQRAWDILRSIVPDYAQNQRFNADTGEIID